MAWARAMLRGTMDSIKDLGCLTDHAQHVLFVGTADANVARDEFGWVFKIAQGLEGGHQHEGLQLNVS